MKKLLQLLPAIGLMIVGGVSASVVQVLPAVGLAVVASASAPSEASAQDCRQHCDDCGSAPNWYESTGEAEEFGWGGACAHGFCYLCEAPSPLVKGVPMEAEKILDAVRRGRPSDMKTIARDYGKFLLIQPERQLLVIKGLNCDPEGLGAVVPLSREKTDALRAAGVGNLAEFILRRANVATTAKR